MGDIQDVGFNSTQEDKSSLSENGIYYFTNDFSLPNTKEVITWILDSNLECSRKYDHLTLIITSYGGELASAFALIDVMRGSSIPVHTIGLGVVASAALMTFIAGAKGHRVVTPNTSILSHQWTAGMWGKEHELVATSRRFELINTKVFDHYKKCTKLSEKIIREKLLPPQDVWLSAEEAVKYNLADTIKDVG